MQNNEGFEVDFLAVGNGQRSGDAIAIRFGSVDNYRVLVYDGGTKEAGTQLVAHIRKYYETNRVDYVVNSHPDGDHASGLSVVLEELEVGELWMHQPWNYSEDIRHHFRDGRITDESLAKRLQEKMGAAFKLEKLAEEKGISIKEPFAGEIIGGIFQILSPSKTWYRDELIKEFAKSPELKEAVAIEGFGTFVRGVLDKVANFIEEHWDVETLRDDVETSAENESSVILFGKISNKGILLTGDAGVRALHAAADQSIRLGIDLPNQVTIVQIPHHGSRNNVSTGTMNRVFGQPTPKGTTLEKTAIASAAKESETHPRRVVKNAFLRRGYKVLVTKGQSKRHPVNMPDRPGWVAVTYESFSSEVEAWD
ncbi:MULTISPECIES: MBL fold metallo-hydrolase [unclassified Herbaspirillum]|uniref:ComEC/Rec2 family competence protein n=1 Tax=unclassified Herbaspirillum TaxID=2624150 RepID=UPI0018F77C4B|nr:MULTISPECIES: MBL fold metallo-hydrolase [unclassified Herbaspirillum]